MIFIDLVAVMADLRGTAGDLVIDTQIGTVRRTAGAIEAAMPIEITAQGEATPVIELEAAARAPLTPILAPGATTVGIALRHLAAKLSRPLVRRRAQS